jgi:prepilin peptidase CpaA
MPIDISRVWGLTLVLLLAAAAIDLSRREIPDWVSLGLLALAIGARAMHWTPDGWISMLVGFVAGFAIGLFLFWRGGFGGGDAKVIAALGAVLGPGPFLSALFYIALAGGGLAMVAILRGRREIAYAPAIAIGFAAFVIAQGIPQ